MPSMLVLGAALVFVALVTSLSVVGGLTHERRGVARSVASIKAMEGVSSQGDPMADQRSFVERVIAPLGERLVGLGRKLVRADTSTKLQYRLDIAGNPPAWDVNRIIGLKALGLGVVGAFTLLYAASADWSMMRVVIVTGLAAAFGFVLPNVLLYNAGQKREKQIRNSLPDALDLLTVSVEAGLGFDAAVARVAKNTSGPLSQEFSRLLREMQIGVGRADAMRAMANRSSLEDLKSFCLAMVQADSLGIPIARVLRIQSSEMRTKRRQRAEEKAQQVPIRIMIPLVLFILPCLFVIILGPAFIQIAQSFTGL